MARPERVYVTIAAVGAFVSTLAFTITPFYRFQVAGLDNFELVLAGTLMEAAVFCFEIPTGVVADQWSRKWSVIVGHLGIGVGLLIEASVPSVGGVLVGQVVWGIAYTFTSGATVAWLTGELDEPDRVALTRLFLRASRFGSGAALVAVPLAFLLGGWSLRLPIVIAGGISVLLGGWLMMAMGEEHFEPASDHATWRGLAHTAGEGVRAIRSSRVLVMLAVAIFLAGGASEVYDRYNEKYLLVDIGAPAWPGWSGLTWMAVIGCMSAALGVVVPWWFQRRHGHLDEPAQRRWIVWLVVVQVVGLLTMAATGSFVVAAAATLLIDRVRSLRGGLLGAWIVPLTPRRNRATVLSTLEQTDSIGQVTLSPALGVIGQVAGISAALAASVALLAPSAIAVRRAGVALPLRAHRAGLRRLRPAGRVGPADGRRPAARAGSGGIGTDDPAERALDP